MANCGCTDTTPCGTKECGCKFEVDAGCVRYTGDTLSCIDAQTGDRLSDILLNLNTQFCSLVEGNYIEVTQEVAGANCEVGGLKIVVKSVQTDAVLTTEYLCTQDVSGFVTGSGKANRVTRWTPVDDQLGESIIIDNGDQLSIGAAPDSVSKVYIVDSIYAVTQKILQTKTTGVNNALSVQSSGVGATSNSAIVGSASGASVNVGVTGSASGSGTNYGGFFQSSNATTNIGVYGQASGTGVKYSAKLLDGTEGIGKVLTCMTANGEANWATPSGVSGSGTLNYIPRWTPDGLTLGNSTLRDDGTTVSIGAAPNSGIQFYLTTALSNGLYIQNSNASSYALGIGTGTTGAATTNIAMYSQAINATSSNIGGQFTAGGSDPALLSSTDVGVRGTARSTTRTNIGGYLTSMGVNSGINIGVKAEAILGSTNYSAQLIDGTEGVGKVLTCMTSDGKAQWATPTATGMTWTTLSGVSPTATLAKNNGYIIRDISGPSTGVTLPAYGTCAAGDKIEISAAGESIASLANWTLTAGNASDKVYGSFVSPSGLDSIEIVKNGPGVLFNFNGAAYTAQNPRKISITLLCVKDTGSAYHWQILHSTSWSLV